MCISRAARRTAVAAVFRLHIRGNIFNAEKPVLKFQTGFLFSYSAICQTFSCRQAGIVCRLPKFIKKV
jgi:hypothetical protein